MNQPLPLDQVSDERPSRKPMTAADLGWWFLRVLASLRLTVILFTFALFLVFFGTLAQTQEGTWTAVDKYFRSAYVQVPLQLFAKFAQTFFSETAFEASKNARWNGSFLFPGGWLIGSIMLVNLLAAHITRFRWTWKRSGILLIHGGFIALMLGELITGLFAVESRMIMQKGEATNFLDDSFNPELAFYTSENGTEKETVIPKSMLKPGEIIRDERLPVDLEIISYHKNSSLVPIEGGRDEPGTIIAMVNPAQERNKPDGLSGTRFRLQPAPEAVGVKSGKEDAPAAKVRLLDKVTHEEIGTYFFSLWQYRNFNMRRMIAVPCTLTANGRTFTVELRNRRVWKPFTMTLIDFEHKVYPGTGIAKDFVSTINLGDQEKGVSRAGIRIWMNHPLRYGGEAFYQNEFFYDDSGTVLQVVNNPVYWLPYAACLMVGIGLIVHFVWVLVGFMRKVRLKNAAQLVGYERLVPWAAVFLAGAYLAYKAMLPSPKAGEMDVYSFGQIPIQDGGRIKPIDTYARSSLIILSKRSEFEDSQGKKQPAVRLLLDMMASNEQVSGESDRRGPAAKQKIFRLDYDQLLDLLSLKARDGYRYSLKEIEENRYQLNQKLPDGTVKEITRAEAENLSKAGRQDEIDVVDKFAKRVQDASRVAEDDRDVYERRVLELDEHMKRYEQIVDWLRPGIAPVAGSDDQWAPLFVIQRQAAFLVKERATAVWRDPDSALSKLDAEMFGRLMSRDEREYQRLLRLIVEQESKTDRPLPPDIAELKQSLQSMIDLHRQTLQELSPKAVVFKQIIQCYAANDSAGFNGAVKEYHEKFTSQLSTWDRLKVRGESYFNHFAPFYYCGILYLVIIVLACLSWLVWMEPLRRTALALSILTVTVHTLAIFARMYLQGRPPVTNLYSSAIFIGWGCVLLCLLLENFFRNSIGNAVGAVLGAITMYIAYKLAENGSSRGDTMEMLQAVLDTDFWLATHVTTVTLGYTATYVTGFIALIYIIFGVFTKTLDEKATKTFGQMMYGVASFAMILSFVGTVLGGIWADQSWGRFWGWDPKENGAVLVVIMNAMILHARWCGMIKQRGMAILALVGNMVTTWSWFGTNQLGVGLHAYGFDKELAKGCFYFWLSQLALIGIALLPLKYWRSYSETTRLHRAARLRDELKQRNDRPNIATTRG